MALAIAASMLVWAIWAVTWIVLAIWSRRSIARAPSGEHLIHWVLTVSGFVLLLRGVAAHSYKRYIGAAARAAAGDHGAWPWIGFALVLGGFAFALWARIHLGALWSGTVTRKEGHRIVDTGPYGLVRHPIYTGLIAGALGLAAQQGAPMAYAGAALIAVGYWFKARLEERFLRQELGAADYDAYRARTPMLVPFLRLPTRASAG